MSSCYGASGRSPPPRVADSPAARALAAGDGGDDASPGALGRIEERLARIEETLQEVAARPSKNS